MGVCIMKVNTSLAQTVKIFFFIVIISLLISPDKVKGENWILYSNLSGENYYDRDSINNLPDNIVTVWSKVIPSQEWVDLFHNAKIEYEKMLKKEGKKDPFKKRKVKDDELSYQKTLTKIDCILGSYKYIKMIQYNKSGEIIFSTDDNPNNLDDTYRNFYDFAADTPGYKLFRDMCSYSLKN
jgi:hypothetical protein